MAKLTVLTLSSRLTSDAGRFTKQFFKCTRDTSAAADGAFFRGAMTIGYARNRDLDSRGYKKGAQEQVLGNMYN